MKAVVVRYLDCGNPRSAFGRIRCPDCAVERIIDHLKLTIAAEKPPPDSADLTCPADLFPQPPFLTNPEFGDIE